MAQMKKVLLLLLLLQALSLTACGSSGPSTRIDITITDFMFSPDEFTVSAGEEITVRATHNGTVAHNVKIMRYGSDLGEEFDDEDKANIYWEMDVRPDGTETARFIAPTRPGVYLLVCAMPGHMQAGMIGRLVVAAQK